MHTEFVAFRADRSLVAALAARARAAGTSMSEVIRDAVREKVGLQ